MPRTLPWLKDRRSEGTTCPRVRVPPLKRRRLSPTVGESSSSSDELPTATGLHAPARLLDAQTPRSPSTSPPPAPPETHLMRPGDDAWRMVEDEFEATAKLYTLHVHNAEYLRQKALARERESRFGEIARPVVGGLSKEAERHMAVERQRRATVARGVDGEEEGVEDPWMGTQLAGLMMGPKRAVKLRARDVGHGRSHTRAAAGFDSATSRGGNAFLQAKEEALLQDTTDDDLDAPVKTQSRARAETKHIQKHRPSETDLRPASSASSSRTPGTRTHTSNNKSGKGQHPPSAPDDNPPRKPSAKRKPSPSRPQLPSQKPRKELHPTKTEPGTGPLSETGFPSIPLPLTKTVSSVLARRREARLKREKEDKDKAEAKASVHELPTFLF